MMNLYLCYLAKMAKSQKVCERSLPKYLKTNVNFAKVRVVVWGNIARDSVGGHASRLDLQQYMTST